MKTGLRKILNTFSDFSNARDDEQSPREGSESNSSTRSKKKNQAEIIRLLTDLGEERKKTLELHERLQSLLTTNTEMRAAAAMQVDEERRLRRTAELRIRDSRSRLARAEKALLAAQLEKDSLEAELMEAASDVVAHHTAYKAYQEKMEGEKAAWQLLEQANEDRTQLEKRLKASEAQRMNLLKSMSSLRNQSQQWGDVFDLLQAEKPSPERNVVTQGISELPNGFRLPSIAEYENEGDALDPSKERSLAGSADLLEKVKQHEKKGSAADDITFISPAQCSSPRSMFGSDLSVKPPLHPSTPERTLPLPPAQDFTADGSDVSMSSHESIFVEDDSKQINLGDYIMTHDE